MTREETIKWLKEMKDTIELYNDLSKSYIFDKYPQAIDMAISALEVQKCHINTEPSDLISRADAIEAVEDNSYGMGSRASVKAINALPSAERVGEWIEKERHEDEDTHITEWQSAKCSVCGKYLTTPFMYYFTDYPYCPSCGAKMKGGAE